MYKYLIRDYSYRFFYSKNEYLRRILFTMYLDLSVNLRFRLMAHAKLNSVNFVKSSSIRLHNRCTFTGRSRSIIRTARVSRIMFRKLASNGSLPGIKKISW